MTYSAEINRLNPSFFLFLIDQSGSMKDPFPSSEAGRQKSEGVADAINRLLQSLVIRCASSDGPRDYYSISVLGYGETVGPALGGSLQGRDLVKISEIADNPLRIEERIQKIEDGAGGLVDSNIKKPIWFDPIANGATPMCEVFIRAQAILSSWLTQNPDCFPPIVINITDGESTDGDPTEHAKGITSLCSSDGNVLLFNLHISSVSTSQVIEFPNAEISLPPDPYAKLLFDISSIIPEYMRRLASQEGYAVTASSRGFVFNGDLVSLIRFIDIGTRAANLR